MQNGPQDTQKDYIDTKGLQRERRKRQTNTTETQKSLKSYIT